MNYHFYDFINYNLDNSMINATVLKVTDTKITFGDETRKYWLSFPGEVMLPPNLAEKDNVKLLLVKDEIRHVEKLGKLERPMTEELKENMKLSTSAKKALKEKTKKEKLKFLFRPYTHKCHQNVFVYKIGKKGK